MPGASTFDFYDRLMDDDLCELLSRLRAETPPMSYDRIRMVVEQATGRRPGRETIRRWLKDECP